MYCHEMDQNESHLLNRGFSKLVKKLSRHPLCNMEHVVGSVHFEITSRMFYVFENYHRIAHGTFHVDQWTSMINALHSFGNYGNGVQTTILSQEYNYLHILPFLKVAYPGSKCIYDFDMLKISHHDWLNVILTKGVQCESRDIRCCTRKSIIRRITFGWSQIQDSELPKTNQYKNKSMPYPSFPNFRGRDILSESLKLELGKILSLSQIYVDKLYGNIIKMNNIERNKLFGNVLGRTFWSASCSRFEFITVSVETNSIIGRHIDYMNSSDEDYNVGCSYSYLIYSFGYLFRVSFIMCNRSQVDQFLKTIQSE